MHGAPHDLALTFPRNWQEQTLNFQTNGPEQPIIEFLQKYIRRHGWKSIAVSAIQDLAKWAIESKGPEGDHPFTGLRRLLTDIENSAGGWAIKAAIQERQRSINAHPIDFSLELEACQAEWNVLNYLLKHGWSSMERPRQEGNFDWEFQRNQTATFGVEVKQKASIGTAGHMLEWWLKGLSLLTDFNWMQDYRWDLQISESTKLKNIKSFGEDFQTNWEQISVAINAQLAHAEGWSDLKPIGDTGMLIGSELNANKPSILLTLSQDSDIRVIVSQNDYPGVISITGNRGGWMLPVLGENEVDEVKRVFNRLRAAQQNESRSNKGLFVFVWWIPHHWETAYDRTWIRDACNAVAQELSLDYVAIWPRGLFETIHEPWVLSTHAVSTFSELEDYIYEV